MRQIGRPVIFTEERLLELLEIFWQEGNQPGWGAAHRFSKFAGISERQLRRKISVLKALKCPNLLINREAPGSVSEPIKTGGPSKARKKPRPRSNFWS